MYNYVYLGEYDAFMRIPSSINILLEAEGRTPKFCIISNKDETDILISFYAYEQELEKIVNTVISFDLGPRFPATGRIELLDANDAVHRILKKYSELDELNE